MRLNRSPFKPRASSKYKIENKSADEATVYIYDEISWWGISAQKFAEDLNAITAGTIHVRMNCPGGVFFDGTALYSVLKEHKAKIITHIDGLAASIASIIALAGDEIRMGENAYYMIHEPWGIVIGMAEDMRKEADLLDKLGGGIITTYMNKTKKTEAQIREWMAAETWFNAQEALDAGFVDIIDKEEKEKAQAMNLFDLSVFANVPDKLMESKKTPTERDLERILRDAGCSHAMAKAILAEGFPKNQRDVETPGIPKTEKKNETVQRDVETVQPKAKRDRVADLLIRAEVMAPTKQATA